MGFTTDIRIVFIADAMIACVLVDVGKVNG